MRSAPWFARAGLLPLQRRLLRLLESHRSDARPLREPRPSREPRLLRKPRLFKPRLLHKPCLFELRRNRTCRVALVLCQLWCTLLRQRLTAQRL